MNNINDFSYIKNSESLRKFQIEAIQWLNTKEGSGLMALPMGSGKCLISLAYTVQNWLKTLIVCPNSLKFVWTDEIERWTDKNYEVINAKDKEINFDKYFTIINYDIVKKFLPTLQQQNFDCVIVDESHWIKSQKALRSKAVKKLNTPKKILLTGTPLTNTPMDLWNQLNYLSPDDWKNWLFFRNRYIRGYIHHRFNYFIMTGTQNIQELSEKIKPFVFRKRKEEILKDLPPKIYNKIVIDIDGEYSKQYKSAMQNFRNFLVEYTDLTKPEIRRRLRGEAFTRVQLLKQICSEHKVKGNIIKSVVENILESNPDDKIVIFSQYRKTVKDLHQQIQGSVVMHGGMDIDERKKSVGDLQNNPKIKVFIGTIQVAGVGLTLTRASHVIFVDLCWSPSEQEQGIDRLHRIGTHKPVNIFYILSRETIDEVIYNLLNKKQSTIDQIIDGQEYKKPVNVYNRFIKNEIKKIENERH